MTRAQKIFTPYSIVIAGGQGPLLDVWDENLTDATGDNFGTLFPGQGLLGITSYVGGLIPGEGNPSGLYNSGPIRLDRDNRLVVQAQSQMGEAVLPLQRPSNTDAYAAGEIIVIGAQPMDLSGINIAAPFSGSPGWFQNFLVSTLAFATDDAIGDLDIFIWAAQPSFFADTDQTPFAPSLSDLSILVGVMRYTNSTDAISYGTGNAYFSGNVGWTIPQLQGLAFSTTTPQVYVTLVARSAFTPISDQNFIISLQLMT